LGEGGRGLGKNDLKRFISMGKGGGSCRVKTSGSLKGSTSEDSRGRKKMEGSNRIRGFFGQENQLLVWGG